MKEFFTLFINSFSGICFIPKLILSFDFNSRYMNNFTASALGMSLFTKTCCLSAVLTMAAFGLNAQVGTYASNDEVNLWSFGIYNKDVTDKDKSSDLTGYLPNDLVLGDVSPDTKELACNNNTLSNPGFESGTSSWTTSGGGFVVSVATAGNSNIYQGDKSFRMNDAGSYVGQVVVIQAGQTYCVSAQVKNLGGAGSTYVGVKFYNNAGSVVGESSQIVSGNSDWSNYQMSGTTPGGTTSAEIYAYRDPSTNAPVFVDAFAYQGQSGGGGGCVPVAQGGGGNISPAQISQCVSAGGSYDPPQLNATAVSCASGSPIYRWQIKPLSMNNDWQDLANGSGQNYNSPALGVGSYWLRRSVRCPCESDFSENTNTFDYHIYAAPAVNVVQYCYPDNSAATLWADASGGTGNLYYNWSNGDNDDLADYPNGASYSVTVTDDNSCPTVISGTVNCSGGGGGGCVPASTGGSINTPNITQCVPAGGTYDPPQLNATVVNCASGNPIYRWQIKPLSMNNDWQNLAGGSGQNYNSPALGAGSYWLRRSVRCPCESDFSQNTNTFDYHIYSSPVVNVNTNCSGNSATLTANVSGGTGNKYYSWSNGDNDNTASYNNGAAYSVTVTDDNSCPTVVSGTVSCGGGGGCVPANTGGSINTPNITQCVPAGGTYDPPQLNATVVTCASGNPIYRWQIKPLSMNNDWQDLANGSGQNYNSPALGVGSYWLRRSVRCPCESDFSENTNTFDYHIYAAPAVNVVQYCYPDNSAATLWADASGGTGNLYYNWSNGDNDDLADYPNGASYSVTVTDDNSCPTVISGTVNCSGGGGGGCVPASTGGSINTPNITQCVPAGGTYDPPQLNATPVTCTSGTPIYRWQIKPLSMNNDWQDLANGSGQNYNSPPLSAGSYWLRRSVRCPCETGFSQNTNTFDYHIQPAPVVNVSVNCSGNSATLTANVSGGTGNKYYSWNNGDNDNTATYSSGAFYSLTVTDDNSCPTVVSGTVSCSDPCTGINAGTIGSNESQCGGYDPATVTGNVLPAGTQYQWQVQSGSSVWTTVSGQNGPNFNPGFINQTTYIRRQVRKSGACPWLTSNVVTKEVLDNISNPGSLAGNQSNCTAFNPSNITGTVPSGGSGGTIIYQWQVRTGTSGTWSNIAGATGQNYDPGTITQTMQYRRGARRNSANCGFIFTGEITKQVQEQPTNPGTLSGNQTQCGTYNPAIITGTAATGGSTDFSLSYQWQFRNATTGSFTDITGATGQNYDPGQITQTTEYRRLARRGNGCGFSASNIITKSVSGSFTVTTSLLTNPNCFGANSGRIIVAAPTSGTGPYTYSISPQVGTVVNLRDFVNLPAGTYTFTVTDANGCTGTVTRTLNNPTQLVANAGPNKAICVGGSTTLTASAAGGTGAKTYTWMPGNLTRRPLRLAPPQIKTIRLR